MEKFSRLKKVPRGSSAPTENALAVRFGQSCGVASEVPKRKQKLLVLGDAQANPRRFV